MATGQSLFSSFTDLIPDAAGVASAMSAGASRPTTEDMYKTFQAWALRNYGDSGKTKTVTRRKYGRIIQVLTGEESPTTDNSKFRFWVKGKGFRLGPPPVDEPCLADHVLYVPTKSSVSR